MRQAEKLRGDATEPSLRFLVTDAAALCTVDDAQSDRKSGSQTGVRQSGAASASGAASPQAMSATASGSLSAAVLAEEGSSRSPVDSTASTERSGHDRQPGAGGTGREEGPRKLSPGSFDTVVDTFGLCSHEDPVAALKARSSLGTCLAMLAGPVGLTCRRLHGLSQLRGVRSRCCGADNKLSWDMGLGL